MSKKIANHIQKNENLTLQFLRLIEQGKKYEIYISVCFIFYKVQTTLYSLSLLSHYPILVDFHTIKANIQRNLVFKFWLFFGSFAIFYQLIEYLKLIEKW